MTRTAMTHRLTRTAGLASAIGAAAVLAVAAGAALAGPRHEGARMEHAGEAAGELGMAASGMHPRMLERMADELGLSDAQRQSIRGLYESARPAMERRREQARANAELMRKTQPGDADYQAVVARVSRAAGELAAAAVSDGAQLRAQVWGVLNPEQRVKAQQLSEQMQQRREERRAKFRDRMEERRKGGAMEPRAGSGG